MDNTQSKRKILVSVIIPCFNYAKYLPEAVASIVNQGISSFEIIIVNDGSTDDTESVVRKLQQKYKGISYVKQQNAGPSAARNSGLNVARGEYILCLDADDRLTKGYFRHCLDTLRNSSNAGYAYTQMELFGAKSEVTKYPQFNLEKLKKDNYIHISALFRRSVLEGLSYDVRLRNGFEDWDIYLTLAERGVYGVLVDKALLQYRKHAGGEISITDTMDSSHSVWHTKIRIQAKHIRFVGLKNIFITLRASIKHDIFRFKKYIKTKIMSNYKQ